MISDGIYARTTWRRTSIWILKHDVHTSTLLDNPQSPLPEGISQITPLLCSVTLILFQWRDLKDYYISARYRSDAWTCNAPETSLHIYKIDSISSSKPSMVVSRGGVDKRGAPINQSLTLPPQNLVLPI